MKICLKRMLSLSVVLVFVAEFYSIGVCERVYAGNGNRNGTTSGSGMDNWSSTDNDTSGNTGAGEAGPGKPWKSVV